MTDKRLLLLSSSRTATHEGFLDHAEDMIRSFLEGTTGRLAFIPYAGVGKSWDEYTEMARARFSGFGLKLTSVHETDPETLLSEAAGIVVAGGNTFNLLAELYRSGLRDPVRERVLAGLPYIGWSAGSNLACPTIKTTNDMPIVYPPSFEALNLVPFQINPHYLDQPPPGHRGETRAQRLAEFLALNPDSDVIGLREGAALEVASDKATLRGETGAVRFQTGRELEELSPGTELPAD